MKKTINKPESAAPVGSSALLGHKPRHSALWHMRSNPSTISQSGKFRHPEEPTSCFSLRKDYLSQQQNNPQLEEAFQK
ncbi:MAG: hypothetical protein ABIP80_02280 [Ferruginibacter sp.]